MTYLRRLVVTDELDDGARRETSRAAGRGTLASERDMASWFRSEPVVDPQLGQLRRAKGR
jgi:hypothetical protein